jgi:hypothetical protein
MLTRRLTVKPYLPGSAFRNSSDANECTLAHDLMEAGRRIDDFANTHARRRLRLVLACGGNVRTRSDFDRATGQRVRGRLARACERGVVRHSHRLELRRHDSGRNRRRERQGFRHWVVRPESVRQIQVGAHEGLSAIADFESTAGGMRIEYLTWIDTPESRVLFFATMSPDQLAAFRPEFDRIVLSATLP